MTTGSSNDGQGPRNSASAADGASSLLSMFAPPPGATPTPVPVPQSNEATTNSKGAKTSNENQSNNETGTDESAKTEAATTPTNDASTTSPPSTAKTATLMGIFQPQPAAAATATTSTGSTGPGTNDASTAHPVSPNTATLMSMFQPPPTAVITATTSNDSAGSGRPPSPGTANLMSIFDPLSNTATTPVRSSKNLNNAFDKATDDAAGYQSPTNASPNHQYRRENNGGSNDNSYGSTGGGENGDDRPNSRYSDYVKNLSEHTGLLQSLFAADENETTPRMKKVAINYDAMRQDNSANDAFQSLMAPLPVLQKNQHQPSHQQEKETYDDGYYVPVKQALRDSSLKATAPDDSAAAALTFNTRCKEFFKEHFQPTTFAGAPMFCLYHIVFCLANGSAIVRPHGTTPILGVMAKLTAVGIFFAGPFYIRRLGGDIPAVYPSSDLFLAPFMASAAAIVDQTMAEDGIGVSSSLGKGGNTTATGMADDSDAIFFATFAVLASIGMLSAGFLLLMAATFRLANLGSFIPYSVLCGFFSAVGVLLWALAFSVDTSGKKWEHVFFSGDLDLIAESLMHHAPSFVVGILMNILGPKHPFYVILLIIMTVVTFYTTMWITGTSLEEAQEQKWFWSQHELSVQATSESEGLFDSWVVPLPFAHLVALFKGKVHWRAVKEGLSSMFVLAVLYLLRSSIHASAMKKNINNLVCKKRVKKQKPESTNQLPPNELPPTPRPRKHRREPSYAKAAMDAMSENVRLVNESLAGTQNASGANQSIRPSKSFPARRRSSVELPNIGASEESEEYEYILERPKPCRKNLQGIFVEYGYALMLVGCSGGFGICPTVATSNTMFAIGASGPAPQYGSILLLIFFYLTDFTLVRYIPKACFSSLLVLGAVDTFVVWFGLSYRKTQDLTEWLVVPVIVLFSLIVGFLNAVFLGVGISTFVFVAAFFRVGVVKFNATGMEIRSTIERSVAISEWLDMHGDLVQVLVLQNYLFFGNASSILNYIATMFEDVVGSDSIYSSYDLPPKPKVLIIDMSLNTGMDTSTLDIFAEIKDMCKNNGCKLYLCGLSNRAKKGLSLTGVKPEPGFLDQRSVRFFTNLDTALGRAEDFIAADMYEKEMQVTSSNAKVFSGLSGFQRALKLIDEQHGEEFSKGLLSLESHTSEVELESGERLFACDGGKVGERGLFFIESGTLKIERDAGATLTRGRNTLTHNSGSSLGTIGNLHARAGTLGRQRAALKASTRGDNTMTRQFRLARIGPGWVCGAIEGASGMAREGVHIAVTDCRLHHLPFQKLEEMEKDDPILVLTLYKMLSHLMARRQEITIEQLATFHSIMSSPAHSKPVSRAALMALKQG